MSNGNHLESKLVVQRFSSLVAKDIVPLVWKSLFHSFGNHCSTVYSFPKPKVEFISLFQNHYCSSFENYVIRMNEVQNIVRLSKRLIKKSLQIANCLFPLLRSNVKQCYNVVGKVSKSLKAA